MVKSLCEAYGRIVAVIAEVVITIAIVIEVEVFKYIVITKHGILFKPESFVASFHYLLFLENRTNRR